MVLEEQVRGEVLKELGAWSKEHNRLADFKTAMYIKSSLKVYEESKGKFKKSYYISFSLCGQ